MSKQNKTTAPKCAHCGGIYLEGTGGVCTTCRRKARNSARKQAAPVKRKRRSPTCQCGRKAVTVLSVRVGRMSDGFYTVRMALCRSCLELERAMWQDKDPKSEGLR